jgi:uncharacterized protein YcbX
MTELTRTKTVAATIRAHRPAAGRIGAAGGWEVPRRRHVVVVVVVFKALPAVGVHVRRSRATSVHGLSSVTHHRLCRLGQVGWSVTRMRAMGCDSPGGCRCGGALGKPAGGAADREQNREHLDREAHRLVDDAGVEVDVRIQLVDEEVVILTDPAQVVDPTDPQRRPRGTRTPRAAGSCSAGIPSPRTSPPPFEGDDDAGAALYGREKTMTQSAREPVGSVVTLWRYPVKSMLGEELNASTVTERGLAGDRGYALVDSADGKIASAKNPRKWPRMFQFRAALGPATDAGESLPAVRITLPNADQVSSEQADHDERLSRALERAVTLQAAGRGDRQPGAASSQSRRAGTAEEYWPDMEGLDYRDTVTNFDLPQDTFFDCAAVHVLTTATLDTLRAFYPRGRFEVRRFRPNVVVDTTGRDSGFAEDAWAATPSR